MTHSRVWAPFVLSMMLTPLFFGAGCTLKFSKSTGAVLMTTDFGASWNSRSTLTVGDTRTTTLTSVDVTTIVPDPRNAAILFLGTREHGLFASNNAGTTWIQLIPGIRVLDVDFDRRSRCTLYVLTPTRLLKTMNCGDSWDIILNESRQSSAFTSLAVDQFQPAYVFVSSSVGDVFRSSDTGATWTAISRHEGLDIRQLLLDPRNPRIVLIATREGFIFRSKDRGASWKDLSASLRTQDESRMNFRYLGILTRPGMLVYASDTSLYRSRDSGASWERMTLLTPVAGTRIDAVAVHPKNPSEVYYVSGSTLYVSHNAGTKWTARLLPTPLMTTSIFVYPDKAGIVFLGLRRPQERTAYWYSQDDE